MVARNCKSCTAAEAVSFQTCHFSMISQNPNLFTQSYVSQTRLPLPILQNCASLALYVLSCPPQKNGIRELCAQCVFSPFRQFICKPPFLPLSSPSHGTVCVCLRSQLDRRSQCRDYTEIPQTYVRSLLYILRNERLHATPPPSSQS